MLSSKPPAYIITVKDCSRIRMYCKHDIQNERNSNKLSDQKRSDLLILSFPGDQIIPKITAPSRSLAVTQRSVGNSLKSWKDGAISVDFRGNGVGGKPDGGVR